MFHYSDLGFGPSNVTVRIYLNGRLAYENIDRTLRDQQFWQVAAVDGATFEVRDLDNIFRGFP